MASFERVFGDVKDFGRVKSGLLGLLKTPLSAEEPRKWSGARIARIISGSAAKALDHELGDIVACIDSRRIFLSSDARAVIFMCGTGDTLSVRYVRGGKEAKTNLTLKVGR